MEENAESRTDKLLKSFEHYYNITKENLETPFTAFAEFHSHTEKFLLVKAAHIADIDSNEYVFFAELPQLDDELVREISEKAWKSGLEKITPGPGHQNSDVSLIIFADNITDSAAKKIKKTRFYKSYKFSLWGWSHFKLIAMENSSGKISANWQGTQLKKLFTTIN